MMCARCRKASRRTGAVAAEHRFPHRNRLVAPLSRAVVIPEFGVAYSRPRRDSGLVAWLRCCEFNLKKRPRKRNMVYSSDLHRDRYRKMASPNSDREPSRVEGLADGRPTLRV